MANYRILITAETGNAVEASTLGLAPGVWPDRLPTTLNDGQPFQRLRSFEHHGEFAGFIYRQPKSSFELTVFND